MFVDASAMVAILTDEPEKDALVAIIESSDQRVTSAIAIWETAVRLTSKSSLSGEEAADMLDQFLQITGMRVVPIGEAEAHLAIQAYARFGKRRHPADLNMGDCFAYACAKSLGQRLVYIGNDFSQTDVNDGLD